VNERQKILEEDGKDTQKPSCWLQQDDGLVACSDAQQSPQFILTTLIVDAGLILEGKINKHTFEGR
jgi:hypothetical protein